MPDWSGEIVGTLTSSSIPNKSNVESVDIGTSVTNIEFSAFLGCSGLTSVTIGNGITKIWGYSFWNCTNCELFDFTSATSVPALAHVNAFQGTPANKKIVVPDALYSAWIVATNWSSTDNNIVNCIVKASESSLGPL